MEDLYDGTPICRVCLKTSLEYIDFETPLDIDVTYGETEQEVQEVLTYLDCFEECTQLELRESMPQCLCDACGLDLKVAYTFLRRAKRADQILRQTADEKNNLETISAVEVDPLETTDYMDSSQQLEEKSTLSFAFEVESAKEPPKVEPDIPIGEIIDLDEKISFECSHCDEVFYSEMILAIHMDHMHREVLPTKVLDADESMELYELADNAEDIDDTDEPAVCASEQLETEHAVSNAATDLAKSAEDSVDVPEVRYTHDPKSPTKFQCTICPRVFASRRSVILHNWRTHKRPPGAKCKICQQNLSDKVELRQHLESAHGDPVQCDKCDLKCARWKLIDHERQMHQRDFLCNICSKTFTGNSLLTAHLKYHERKEANIKSDACEVCGKRFSTQYYLMKHMRVHAANREMYPCAHCDKVYLTKTALDTHLRMHSGDAEQCPICGKQFPRSYELKVHMRFHNRVYPFSCEVCGKTFAIKGHLRTHMWQHLGLKLPCEQCGKLFGSTKSLYEHAFLHTTMPYPCSYCDKGYPSKQKYKMHLRTVHLVELDENEMQKIAQYIAAKPRRRTNLTLVQVDTVMREVEVKSKEDDVENAGKELEDIGVYD